MVTSSSGDAGVTEGAVGGAVSSLVLRSRAAERRVLGRLEKLYIMSRGRRTVNTGYLFLERFELFSGGEGEGTRPLLRVPLSRRPDSRVKLKVTRQGKTKGLAGPNSPVSGVSGYGEREEGT